MSLSAGPVGNVALVRDDVILQEAGQYSRTASLQSTHSRTPSSQSSLNVPTASATICQRGGKDAKTASSTQPSAKEASRHCAAPASSS